MDATPARLTCDGVTWQGSEAIISCVRWEGGSIPEVRGASASSSPALLLVQFPALGHHLAQVSLRWSRLVETPSQAGFVPAPVGPDLGARRLLQSASPGSEF